MIPQDILGYEIFKAKCKKNQKISTNVIECPANVSKILHIQENIFCKS